MATEPRTDSPYATQLDIERLREATQSDIERLRDSTQLDIERLRVEFHKAINTQTWRIIAAGFTAAGLLLAGIKFL
ncbi:MAG: hypothetical protein OXC83_11620 [Chloroflexi bacterium]|nr:hypothetical protein [Chloroflexota bacterium]